MRSEVDLFIIGGGINGTGIAMDAAGRGLSVFLCEQHDLASGTSSASSKLIHGGLRYLEYFEFSLVRKALAEREILLNMAPQIVKPMPFVLPCPAFGKSPWMLQLGLWCYDFLADRRTLPRSSRLDLAHCAEGFPLKKDLQTGFRYYDCWVDDARLVILNALTAKKHGAQIFPQWRLTDAQSDPTTKKWLLTIQSQQTKQTQQIQARVLINAAGPWVDNINQLLLNKKHAPLTKLVKGSHIIVDKFYSGDQAYLLQYSDRRIIFVLPFLEQYHLIGTTEINVLDCNIQPQITLEEIEYLLNIVNVYFKHQLTPENVRWSYAGIRSLQAAAEDTEFRTITRDHTIPLEFDKNGAPFLTVIGGKITTYRVLAEDCLQQLKKYFPQMGIAWTAKTKLPGGDILNSSVHDHTAYLQQKYLWLPARLAYRYTRSYGTLCEKFLTGKNNLSQLGEALTTDFFQAEIDYLCEQEWLVTIEDLLWRRTKLGLKTSATEIKKLKKYLTIESGYNSLCRSKNQ